jgi:hypothetical protein
LPSGATDLKGIYNNAKINDGGSAKSVSDDPTPDPGPTPDPSPTLLGAPSYAFPFFGEVPPCDTNVGPNDQFRKFANAFDDSSSNQFLDSRDNVDGKLGLVDIPVGMGYSAKDDTTLALIDQTTGAGTDDTPYETYIAPILDILDYQGALTGTMSVSQKANNTYFPDKANIMKNFLFKEGPTDADSVDDIDSTKGSNLVKAGAATS